MLQTICPSCDTPLKAPDEYLGKSPRCPKCRTRVRAAMQEPAPLAVPTPADAPKTHEDKLLDELLSEVDQGQKPRPAGPKPATQPKHIPPAEMALPTPVLQRRERKSGLSGLITVLVSVAVIVAVGGYMISVLMAKQRIRTANRVRDGAGRKMSTIAGLIGVGDKSLKAKNYKVARQNYQKARALAAQVSTELTMALAGISNAEAKEPLLDAQAKAKSLLSEVDGKLKSDELVKGEKGLVFHNGKWVSLDDKMAALGKKFYEEFGKYMTEKEYNEAKGLVKYRNQWMTPEQVATLKKEEAARLAHKETELRAARLAEEKRLARLAKKQKEKEERLAKLKAKRDAEFPPDAERWVLDDFEGDKHLWKVETWSLPCSLMVLDQKGSKRLQMTIERGHQDKAAIGRPIALDLSSRDRIAMDYINLGRGVVKIALALHSNEFYETRLQVARVGEGRLEFNLRAGDFKCQSSNWQHNRRIGSPDAVRRIFVLVYTSRQGVFAIDNVVAEKLK